MEYKAVLFDLDGTLLDTLEDLAKSMNMALTELGFPTHPVQAYRYFVGDATENLVRRTLPPDKLDEQTIAMALAGQARYYAEHWADNTKPYPGIGELLCELEDRSLPMVILSNKPDHFTQLVVNELLGDWSFEIIRGVSPTVVKKPDPTAAVLIADEIRIPPEQFLYLGDTDTDMKTAVAAGMYPIGVLWGFRDAEELKQYGAKTLAEKPCDILKLLN